MKIIVHSPQSTNIRLSLPSGLALNPVSALFLPKFLKQNGIEVDRKQARMMVKAINQYRRRHPDWTLVEVETAGGEHVKITV